MSDLFYQGHHYADKGEAPCPMPGCEDGLVATHTEGEVANAYWSDGHIFVLDVDSSTDQSGMNNLPNLP